MLKNQLSEMFASAEKVYYIMWARASEVKI